MKTIAILVEPELPINVGLVARLCENFEVDELRAVNPKVSREDWMIAEVFASRAKKRIREIKQYNSLEECLQDVDFSVATSAVYRKKGGNILRRAITPMELANVISKSKFKSIGLVFGRESSGLTNKEIEKCDALLTIESSERYRALNLACAVAIVFYEIYAVRKAKKVRIAVDKEMRGRIIEYFGEIARRVTKEENKAVKVKRAFSNVLNRGTPDRREASLIIGVMRRALKEISKEK